MVLGDLCLAGAPENMILADRGYDFWATLRPTISDDDVVIANLECALTESGQPKPYKYATLRASPKTVSALDRIQVAVLGNNHISDFGDTGVQQTLRTLHAAGIQTVGYGPTLQEAVVPAVVSRSGASLAVLSFCCPTTNGENLATHTSAGVAPLGREILRRSIAAARPKADAVLVYVHWGCEDAYDVVPDQIRLARHAVDCGADAVVGCHAHVIQGYERYRDSWILYGLGNFLFGAVETLHVLADGSTKAGRYEPAAHNRQSLLARFKLDGLSRPGLKLAAVEPLAFGDDHVPRPIPKESLTVNLDLVNAQLAEYVQTHQNELANQDEPVFKAVVRNGTLAYFYSSSPIAAESHRPPERPMPSFLRRVVQRVRSL